MDTKHEETPSYSTKLLTIDDKNVWKSYNKLVDDLSDLTDVKYHDFRVEPHEYKSGYEWGPHGLGEVTRYSVDITTFREKLGRLLARLHTEYFPEKRHPYEKHQPSRINQNTNIAITINTVLQPQEQLIKKEDKYPENSSERRFINKLLRVLKDIRDIKKPSYLHCK